MQYRPPPSAPMRSPTIYAGMCAAARPILRTGLPDLRQHDRRISRSLGPGDAAAYAVHESGTHFAHYQSARARGPAEAAQIALQARDYMVSIVHTAPGSRWFLIECTGPQRGTVSPVKYPEAFAVVIAYRDRMLKAAGISDRRAA